MTVTPICTDCRPTPLEQAAAARTQPRSAAAVEAAAAAPALADPLALSGTAQAKALAAAPPVDAGKVAAVRAAIAGGDYAVDPDAIAAKMIALDLP